MNGSLGSLSYEECFTKKSSGVMCSIRLTINELFAKKNFELKDYYYSFVNNLVDAKKYVLYCHNC